MKFMNALLCISVIVVSGMAAATTHACAHRGDRKNAPENTVPAVQSAVNKGAHQIEFDVQRTRDGHLVIMHDGSVNRTTNGSGLVADMDFAAIRALDAGAWFAESFAGTQVPTLEEVLAPIPHEILCNVHLKGDDQLGADVAKTLQRLNRCDHCFMACTVEQAKEAKRIAPEIMICNMSRQGGNRERYIQSTLEEGAEFIQLSFTAGTEGLADAVKILHDQGVKVNWFGASEEKPIRALMEAGVDYILTDDLDLCLKITNEKVTK